MLSQGSQLDGLFKGIPTLTVMSPRTEKGNQGRWASWSQANETRMKYLSWGDLEEPQVVEPRQSPHLNVLKPLGFTVREADRDGRGGGLSGEQEHGTTCRDLC